MYYSKGEGSRDLGFAQLPAYTKESHRGQLKLGLGEGFGDGWDVCTAQRKGGRIY